MPSETSSCLILDSLEMIKNHKVSVYYMQTAVPIIEKQTGLVSHANKGTAGIQYFSDSLFTIDLLMWRNYFKCPGKDN